uniref:Uncharacterized protein n=1 Tax=Glossina pallidipes TaxID=7398 RepID=A0A1A9ZCL2_GLOPL
MIPSRITRQLMYSSVPISNAIEARNELCAIIYRPIQTIIYSLNRCRWDVPDISASAHSVDIIFRMPCIKSRFLTAMIPLLMHLQLSSAESSSGIYVKGIGSPFSMLDLESNVPPFKEQYDPKIPANRKLIEKTEFFVIITFEQSFSSLADHTKNKK